VTARERRPDPRDDRLRDWIRLGDETVAIPAERRDRVRAAVHARWRAALAARRRRRWLLAAAILVVAVGLAVLAMRPRSVPPGEPPGAVVVSLVEDAWQRTPSSAGPPRALTVGGEIRAGTEIATGPEGRIALRLAGGGTLRLDRSTRVRLRSGREWELSDGGLYYDSGIVAGAAGLAVRVPWGRVTDVGTQFEVRTGAAAGSVRVREGAAFVDLAGDQVPVAAGEGITVEAGRATRHRLGPRDPLWAWTESVTPMFDLEGRPALEFLAWAARERGLRLRFSDDVVAARAATVSLSGDIDGLDLEQALRAVLPTCRLRASIEGEELRVDPSGPPS
jgi:ferric-dicitrate binding protein FerR (iron transport regulator)